MDIKGTIWKRGFTIEQVAEQMGIRRESLQQMLSRNPTIKTLQRIAKVIGCNVGDFFRDEIEPPPVEAKPYIICPHCHKKIYLSIGVSEQR